MLVRSLIPGSAPGNTAEDMVTAKIDYARLDHADSPVRIRLNSTAVLERHVGDSASAKQVEVVYGRDQTAHSVRGKGAVLACWNMVIPYPWPDRPAEQKEAFHYGVKVPLVFTVVGLRDVEDLPVGIQRLNALITIVEHVRICYDAVKFEACHDQNDIRVLGPDGRSETLEFVEITHVDKLFISEFEIFQIIRCCMSILGAALSPE